MLEPHLLLLLWLAGVQPGRGSWRAPDPALSAEPLPALWQRWAAAQGPGAGSCAAGTPALGAAPLKCQKAGRRCRLATGCGEGWRPATRACHESAAGTAAGPGGGAAGTSKGWEHRECTCTAGNGLPHPTFDMRASSRAHSMQPRAQQQQQQLTSRMMTPNEKTSARGHEASETTGIRTGDRRDD